jgi:hypothetical protein
MVAPSYRHILVTVLVVVALGGDLALAGCKGGSSRVKALPTPSASPSPSVDASTAAATTEVLRQYNGFFQAGQKAFETGDYLFAIDQYKQYLSESLQESEVNNVYQLSREGAVYEGTATNAPKVSELHLNGSPPTATVVDCFDYTNLRKVSKTNRSPYPASSGNRRFPGGATLILVDGKGWRITKLHSERSQQC